MSLAVLCGAVPSPHPPSRRAAEALSAKLLDPAVTPPATAAHTLFELAAELDAAAAPASAAQVSGLVWLASLLGSRAKATASYAAAAGGAGVGDRGVDRVDAAASAPRDLFEYLLRSYAACIDALVVAGAADSALFAEPSSKLASFVSKRLSRQVRSLRSLVSASTPQPSGALFLLFWIDGGSKRLAALATGAVSTFTASAVAAVADSSSKARAFLRQHLADLMRKRSLAYEALLLLRVGLRSVADSAADAHVLLRELHNALVDPHLTLASWKMGFALPWLLAELSLLTSDPELSSAILEAGEEDVALDLHSVVDLPIFDDAHEFRQHALVGVADGIRRTSAWRRTASNADEEKTSGKLQHSRSSRRVKRRKTKRVRKSMATPDHAPGNATPDNATPTEMTPSNATREQPSPPAPAPGSSASPSRAKRRPRKAAVPTPEPKPHNPSPTSPVFAAHEGSPHVLSPTDEPDASFLDSSTAVELKSTRDALAKARATLASKTSAFASQSARLHELYASSQEQVDELTSENAKLRGALDAARASGRRDQREAVQLESLQRENAELVTALESARASAAAAAESSSSLRAANAALAAKLSEAQSQALALDEVRADLALAQKDARLAATLRRERDDLRAANSTLAQQAAEARSHEAALDELKAQLALARADAHGAAELARERNTLRTQLAEANVELGRADERARESAARHSAARSQLDSRLSAVTSARDKLMRENDALAARLSQVTASRDKLSSRVGALCEAVEVEQESRLAASAAASALKTALLDTHAEYQTKHAAQVAALDAALADKSSQLEVVALELEAALSGHETSLRSLESSAEALPSNGCGSESALVASLKDSVLTATQRERTLEAELEAERCRAAELASRVGDLEQLLETAVARGPNELRDMSSGASEAEADQLARLQHENAVLTSQQVALTATVDELQAELQTSTSRLIAQLEEQSAVIEELEAAAALPPGSPPRDVFAARVMSLQARNIELEAEVGALEAQVTEARQANRELLDLLDAAPSAAEHAALKLEVQSLYDARQKASMRLTELQRQNAVLVQQRTEQMMHDKALNTQMRVLKTHLAQLETQLFHSPLTDEPEPEAGSESDTSLTMRATLAGALARLREARFSYLRAGVLAELLELVQSVTDGPQPAADMTSTGFAGAEVVTPMGAVAAALAAGCAAGTAAAGRGGAGVDGSTPRSSMASAGAIGRLGDADGPLRALCACQAADETNVTASVISHVTYGLLLTPAVARALEALANYEGVELPDVDTDALVRAGGTATSALGDPDSGPLFTERIGWNEIFDGLLVVEGLALVCESAKDALSPYLAVLVATMTALVSGDAPSKLGRIAVAAARVLSAALVGSRSNIESFLGTRLATEVVALVRTTSLPLALRRALVILFRVLADEGEAPMRALSQPELLDALGVAAVMSLDLVAATPPDGADDEATVDLEGETVAKTAAIVLRLSRASQSRG
ncbi:uncharacterized protein AMSG_12117 [Thecamonas trahens ATCC 50062]|uniref:Uncharacterized protein n=1 Tax=Thecamonas trahens ATCC 50062 TaxID=461836 RepID=A0A0L0DHS9_THETB|nr:hypothetical protein AMSG_12117 [Thecamonas trahens ATCC 50062]KNC51867.1 hypothetical protein AMSG_12117 [Thecamonas trahens ATCC 50062]|eukprot:XP_013755775.1 hypothetical protein AMSG_12117 [Thecamonas trahens ATCC 50062]